MLWWGLCFWRSSHLGEPRHWGSESRRSVQQRRGGRQWLPWPGKLDSDSQWVVTPLKSCPVTTGDGCICTEQLRGMNVWNSKHTQGLVNVWSVKFYSVQTLYNLLVVIPVCVTCLNLHLVTYLWVEWAGCCITSAALSQACEVSLFDKRASARQFGFGRADLSSPTQVHTHCLLTTAALSKSFGLR